MSMTWSFVRKMTIISAIALIAVGAIYRLLQASVVTNETRGKIENLSGNDFEIIYTEEDSIGKEEFVSVYGSKSETGNGAMFRRFLDKKTRLFEYNPIAWDSPSPSIVALGPNKILISVPKISSIIIQKKVWGNVSIDYQIGHVDYP